ncbi:MAG TPA: nitroreductase [Steroidobacteraceae bacterium]|jgi:nitroreductase|nr:nitroreductase [Steroidobacteraceae bacterium]
MKVTDAILSRRSCRAFLDTPVPAETLRAILETARQAPSGGNLQPWQVHVLADEPLREFVALIRSKLSVQPQGEGTEYAVYPPNLKEPYRSRRFKCGEDLYAILGIEREEKMRRLRQFARNYEFFGAPAAMFFVIDRIMGADQWADVGMFMQNIMLLARERGLDTCPQESWASWHRTIREFLGLPAELMLFCGLAIGYRDETAAINRLRTERAPLEEFATFHTLRRHP